VQGSEVQIGGAAGAGYVLAPRLLSATLDVYDRGGDRPIAVGVRLLQSSSRSETRGRGGQACSASCPPLFTGMQRNSSGCAVVSEGQATAVTGAIDLSALRKGHPRDPQLPSLGQREGRRRRGPFGPISMDYYVDVTLLVAWVRNCGTTFAFPRRPTT